MAAKTQELNINGRKYKLQHPGLRWFTQHSDRCLNANGITNQEKYLDGLFEHVVIEAPKEIMSAGTKLSIDSFDDYPEDFEELVAAIDRFLRGR